MKFDKTYRHQNAHQQLEFFSASLRKDGGFDVLDWEGRPLLDQAQELHTTTRLVHSYSIAKRAGFEGYDDIIDAGLKFIWQMHRDHQHEGYFWSVKNGRACDDVKLAYGHVFVLLAGASAKKIGHNDAQRLIDDVSQVLWSQFWDDACGLLKDEFTRDWKPFSSYRGMNANMHGIEAFLTAFEATGDRNFLEKAGRILDFFTKHIAPQFSWRIPEHYDENWNVDFHYEGNPMFRPRGTTPGHSFELGRLLIQYLELSEQLNADSLNIAKNIIDQALSDAWHENGGFVYTLSVDGRVDKSARYWWPVTEAISAVDVLYRLTGDDKYFHWYEKLWSFADAHLIDHKLGGWFPEIDDNNQPTAKQFLGKPDLYHSLQSCLFPNL